MPIKPISTNKSTKGQLKWHAPTDWETPSLNKDNGTVFGTWKAFYDPKEFERERGDGTTVIGMVPDCRVFISGAELTPDVSNVNVTNSFSGNTCDITLTNPRGRYEITRSDLRKKWREDKDVLAAYNYDIFKRVDPFQFEKFVDQLSEAAIGKKRADRIKKGLSTATSLDKFLFKRRVPEIRGVTRQIFEVKHFSGITKRHGDIVFDYRDPVYVFFKGRFSPYWYFGFSGIVTGWSDEDTYSSTQQINIRCEDVTSLWKRTKLTIKAPFFPNARGENRVRTTSDKTKSLFADDWATVTTFSDLMKLIVFSYDFGKNAYNCHASSPGASYQPGITKFEQKEAYLEAKRALHDGAYIDETYMFTKNRSLFKNTTNTIKTSNISYPKQLTSSVIGGTTPFSFSGGPNNHPFSTINSLYLQLNEIELADFRAKNVKPYLDISVRYWESDHEIPVHFTKKNKDGTGWIDTRAFGVAGIHPALTYDFVNNFGIIDNIWEQCYKRARHLDKLVMSPLDKVRASLVGSPTEATRGISTKDVPEGTQYNLFRPRLFVIVPQKFADRVKAAKGGTITKVGELFDEEKTTTYEYLHEKLKAIEYIMYATPMGDVIIEPEMYDFHPLEFSSKIEPRSIIKKDKWVKYRTLSSNHSKRGQARYDKAYFFDSKANHPFFLMEKDRIRCTQTFKQELIHTVAEVRGGQTEHGGVTDVLTDTIQSVATFMANKHGWRGHDQLKGFAWGLYIADGFEKYFDARVNQTLLKKEIENSRNGFNKMVFAHLLINDQNTKIQNILDDFIEDSFDEPIDDKFFPVSRDTKIASNETIISLSKESVDTEAKQAVYTFVFDALEDHLTRTVKQLISKSPKQLKSKGKDAAIAKQNQSTIKGLMGVSILEYENALKAFDKMELSSSSALGVDIRTIFQLIEAYAPVAVKADEKIGNAWIKLYEKEAALAAYTVNEDIKVLTIADEKELVTKGLYDPRKDLVKLYGHNPAPPIKNTFIQNGIEAYDYAKTVFNRYLGKAFEIQMDLIGRPELLLNRTCYCERKDAIGLLTNYSIKWSHGKQFSSSATLSYVRKSAVTFEYSLNELDPFVGTAADNDSFVNEAKMYYKWNELASTGAKTLSNKIRDSISGGDKGTKTITHTTESPGIATANIRSNLSSAYIATATAKVSGPSGDNIAYKVEQLRYSSEGILTYYLETAAIEGINIIQLVDNGNLGELAIGNFLVLVSSPYEMVGEIVGITNNIITLASSLNNTYNIGTPVTRMEWKLSFATAPGYSDIETRGPFPVSSVGDLMFVQNFSLVTLSKSDHWYAGRGDIYPTDLEFDGHQLSGGAEVQTVTTKVITPKESTRSAKSLARKVAGNITGNLVKNVLDALLPLGGIFTSHDELGHMEYDKRGFSQKVENLSFAKAHSVGQSHIEDEMVYQLVYDIQELIGHRDAVEAQYTTLLDESDSLAAQYNTVLQEFEDINQELNTTPNTEQDKLAQLASKKSAIVAKMDDVEDDIRAVNTAMTKFIQLTEEYNKLLYGQKAAPSDLTDHIYTTYITFKYNDTTTEEYTKIEPILDCYFFRLYELHISLFGGEPEDWSITETDPESITFKGYGSTPYYISKTSFGG